MAQTKDDRERVLRERGVLVEEKNRAFFQAHELTADVAYNTIPPDRRPGDLVVLMFSSSASGTFTVTWGANFVPLTATAVITCPLAVPVYVLGVVSDQSNWPVVEVNRQVIPVPVGMGGTGAITLTDNGVVFGNGTAAIGATAEGATGTVLIGTTGSGPSFSASPTVTTVKCTGLTDTYLPKHTSDAAGLENSPVYTDGTVLRLATSAMRRYYHIPLGSENPGASGATWIPANANTTGGWRLDAATELLRGDADIHADWDGASDPIVGVRFMVNIDNTGGAPTDTVDLKLTCYYKGNGDTATKTQTVEQVTTVGQSAQYKQFTQSFPINWDAVSNVLEAGDDLSVVLNLETDTSEVDDIVIESMELYYNTTHLGIESGDV